MEQPWPNFGKLHSLACPPRVSNINKRTVAKPPYVCYICEICSISQVWQWRTGRLSRDTLVAGYLGRGPLSRTSLLQVIPHLWRPHCSGKPGVSVPHQKGLYNTASAKMQALTAHKSESVCVCVCWGSGETQAKWILFYNVPIYGSGAFKLVLGRPIPGHVWEFMHF